MNKVRKGLRYGFDAADCLTGGAYSAPQGALAERYESCFAQRGLWGPYLSAALMTLQRGAGGQPLFSPATLPPRLELKFLGQLLDSPAPAGCMMGWQRGTLQCKSLLGTKFCCAPAGQRRQRGQGRLGNNQVDTAMHIMPLHSAPSARSSLQDT